MYLSGDPFVKNLSSTEDLIWKETGVEFGNWYSGENKDGSIEFHHKFNASEVGGLSLYFMFWCKVKPLNRQKECLNLWNNLETSCLCL